MASGSVPAVKTIHQKIEDAWDIIDRIFNDTSSAQLTTLDEFMKKYSNTSTLSSFISNLFKDVTTTPRGRKINDIDVKSHLFNHLVEIKNIPRIRIASTVLHTNGNIFLPTRLMCLFVCGLIQFDSMSFDEWMKMGSEDEKDYIREFLSLFCYTLTINVYLNVTNGVEVIDANNMHVIPDTLFYSSGIPENARNVVIMDSFPEEDPWLNLRESIISNNTVTSDPVFWYAYVIRDCTTTSQASSGPSTTVQAWADVNSAGAAAPPDAGAAVPADASATKCIGVVYGERKYIFAYNFPKFDRSSSDTVTLWKNYITEPYKQYANILQSYTLNQDTAFIGKVILANPVLIYIYVLVMGIYGGNRNFYAYKDYSLPDETIQDAFVAGITCSDYLALLSHAGGSIPLTIDSGSMNENVMERLANAHLKLMKKNASFTFSNQIDMNFDDELDSTCPVKYDWVFNNTTLAKCANWITRITKEVDDIEKNKPVTLDRDLGVLRRIMYWMSKKFGNLDSFSTTARKFTKKVLVGAKVDKNDNQRIVLDLSEYGSTKNIFSRTSTLQTFLSSNSSFANAMKTYFVGDCHPDDVFHKYMVHDTNDDTYFIRDSVQMQIDNTDLSQPPAQRLPSGSSATSSNSSQKSFDPEKIPASPLSPLLPPIKSAWKPGQEKKPVSNTMKTVLEMVDTWVDTDERVEGGLGAILRELNDFATVDGMNKEERRKKMDELTAEIQKRHDELNQQKTMLDKVIDGLKAEIQKGQDQATKDKDALEAQMKTVRDEKDEVDKKLAASLLRESTLTQEKNDMDTNVQKLTGERVALAAEVDKLTQALQDSQKKVADDAESIRRLTEKVGELEKEIARLTQEIDTLTLKETNLLASDASKQAQIDDLALKEKELADALAREAQLKLEKQDLENKLTSTNKLLSTDAQELLKMRSDKDQLTKEIADLQAQIQQYEDQLKGLIEKLKKGILEHDRQMTTRIWKIHDQVDGSIRKELTESELLVLLRKGEYMGFRDAVKRPVEQKEYELPALFLIYESIGGTWRYFATLTDTNQTSEFMAEKLMESLRLFQTIKKHEEHLLETYTNQYFRKFLQTFKCLAHDSTGEVIETF